MNWTFEGGRVSNAPNTEIVSNSISLEQIEGLELGPPKSSHSDQRKEMIKSKIKSRLSLLLASNPNAQQKPSASGKTQGENSLDEIIEKHTMRNLKRKYLDYLEKGKQ